MSINISPVISALTSLSGVSPSAATPKASGAFESVFADAIKKVESFQANAEHTLNQFLSGEGEEIHKVALAAEQADLSFQLFLQVRNKVVAAYQEVMRMQI
jgi:flagellar hook-basal body complex protein FliE